MSRYERLLPILNWTIATFFCVFQFYLQASASLMAKSWADEFTLTPVGVSSLSAAFFYTYLLMQVPVGFMNDRFNPRWILSGGALLVAIGCWLLAATPSFSVALMARLLMGLGSSVGFVSMLYISAQWFRAEKFTLMVGYSETLGMVGVALSAVISAALISTVGWRVTLHSSALVAFAIAVIAACVVRDQPSAIKRVATRPPLLDSLRVVIRSKTVWLAGFYGFCNFSVINALCSLWGVPFLRNNYHFSLSLAAAIVSMIFYGMAVGSPTLGYLSLRSGKRKPSMLIGSGVGALLLSIALFVPNLSITTLFFLFFFIGVCASSYIQCFAITKEVTPGPTHGVSLAFANLMVMLGAPFYQIAIAGLMQLPALPAANAFNFAIAIIPASFVASTLLALCLRETFCKNYSGPLEGR